MSAVLVTLAVPFILLGAILCAIVGGATIFFAWPFLLIALGFWSAGIIGALAALGIVTVLKVIVWVKDDQTERRAESGSTHVAGRNVVEKETDKITAANGEKSGSTMTESPASVQGAVLSDSPNVQGAVLSDSPSVHGVVLGDTPLPISKKRMRPKRFLRDGEAAEIVRSKMSDPIALAVELSSYDIASVEEELLITIREGMLSSHHADIVCNLLQLKQ